MLTFVKKSVYLKLSLSSSFFQFVAVVALLAAAANGARIPRDSAGYASPSSRSAAAPAPEPVAIVRSVYNAPGTPGFETTYDFDFEAENGIKQSAEGELKTIDDAEVMVMKGSYSYVDNNGDDVVVTWYADETGYHAESDLLPVAPEIPFEEQRLAVEAQIRFAAEEAAAGSRSASNSYQSGSSTRTVSVPAPAPVTYVQPAPAPAPVVVRQEPTTTYYVQAAPEPVVELSLIHI